MSLDPDGKIQRGQRNQSRARPGTAPRGGASARPGTELRYQRLFATAHDGILILDATTGQILDANPFMTTLLGVSHDALLGKELWEVGLLRDAGRSREIVRELREPRFVRHEDLFLQSTAYPEGIDVEVITNSYEEGDGQVIQCHVRDITERKRANLHAVTQAEELAVADRHKNESMAMVSHELRNALAPVANALMVLRLSHARDNQATDKARTLIERQVGHLSRLVDDLQEISGIGTGRMRLRPSRVDLLGVVRRAVEAVMMAHAHRMHRVAVQLPAEPVWLDADVMGLEQVVVNLVSNAANYTPDGGDITVSVSQAQARVELRVTDTGIGIAAELVPLVFDLFTRGETARSHARHGLGLGLNIVRRIVELHGGSVEAHSAGPGTGSEFRVLLPLATSVA